jgi:hypothetical protein
VVVRIAEGLGVPRGWMGRQYADAEIPDDPAKRSIP